jgi:ABC-type dipeptide/oligopeptide/nickel transport system permease subunit
MTEQYSGGRGASDRGYAEAGAGMLPSAAVVVPGAGAEDDYTLTYEHGVEVKARSQWAYARIRFFRHRLALASLIVLILVGIVAIFPAVFAPYGPNEQNLPGIDAAGNLTEGKIAQAPSWDHVLGTDLLGRDYLSRVIFGLQTSLWVAMFVAILSTLIGTAIGALAGYYGGVLDNILMRVTDLVLTLPTLAVLLAAAAFLGQEGQTIGPITLSQPATIALILALLFWTQLARIIRGVFLSLREKEFVEAAKASGASDTRIILRHILPNCVGPIVVTMTLIIAAAILTEAALSFLGFGIQPPEPALGNLIAEGNVGGLGYWWLVTFPGIVIVIIALAVNFIGDGLRDALDPTQRIRA